MKKFKEGDRVRMKGYAPIQDQTDIGTVHNEKGTVEKVLYGGARIHVRADTGYLALNLFPDLCRHLKPRPKKPDAKKELRKVWVKRVSVVAAKQVGAVAEFIHAEKQPGDYIEFTELPPGSVVISREDIERIFHESGAEMMNCDAVCKELGLPEKEKV